MLISGQFTDPDRCVVQFIETNQFVSVGTTIAAFWLPLIIMIVLYSRVYYETKKQQKDMYLLQAGQVIVIPISSYSNNWKITIIIKHCNFIPFTALLFLFYKI